MIYFYFLFSFIFSIFSLSFEDIEAIGGGNSSDSPSQRIEAKLENNRDNCKGSETLPCEKKGKNFDLKPKISGKEVDITKKDREAFENRLLPQSTSNLTNLYPDLKPLADYDYVKNNLGGSNSSRVTNLIWDEYASKKTTELQLAGEEKDSKIEQDSAGTSGDEDSCNNGSDFIPKSEFSKYYKNGQDTEESNNEKQYIMVGDAQANHNPPWTKPESQKFKEDIHKPSQKPIQRPCDLNDARFNEGNGQDVRQECENFKESQKKKKCDKRKSGGSNGFISA